MTVEKTRTLTLSPIVGGIVFLVVGKKEGLMEGKTFHSRRFL